MKLYARHFLLTVGGHGILLPFENNDLPGVFTSQAAGYLLRREGLLVGEAIAVVGTAPGPVQLPRGTHDVVLTFRAAQHLPASRTLKPTEDQALTVALRKRPRARPAAEPDVNDVPESEALFGRPQR